MPRQQDSAKLAIARLLCTTEPELGPFVRLFEIEPAARDESASSYTEVPLGDLDLPYLFEGDELVIPGACGVVLVCYYDSTRRTYSGPCRLQLADGMLNVLEGDPKCEQIEVIEAFVGRPVVEGRVDELCAGQFVRPGRAKSVPVLIPKPTYPVNTNVPPGKVKLTWDYDGPPMDAEVTVTRTADSLPVSVTVAAEARYLEVDVAPSAAYSWSIGVDQAAAAQLAEFHVLGEVEWKQLKTTLAVYGLDGSQVACGLDHIHSPTDLAFLTALLQYYGLQYEAAISFQRMQDELALAKVKQ